MNEEAMTPDKEQVVEPLSAEEEADIRVRGTNLALVHPRFYSLWDVIARLLATLDAERGDRERQFREWKAAQDISVAEWQRQIDAARTASVAGLERYYRAEPLGDDDDGWVVCRGANRVLVVADEAEASRVVSGLNADLFHAAPSIEQEPGEDRNRERAWQLAHGLAIDVLTSSDIDGLREHATEVERLYATREQEPGETLRAAASALRTIRDLCDMNLDEMNATFGSEQRVRIVVIPALVCEALGEHPITDGLRRVLFERFSYLGNPALEADRNPQETER